MPGGLGVYVEEFFRAAKILFFSAIILAMLTGIAVGVGIHLALEKPEEKTCP